MGPTGKHLAASVVMPMGPSRVQPEAVTRVYPGLGSPPRRRILRGCGVVQWTMALAARSLVVETGFRDQGMSPLWSGKGLEVVEEVQRHPRDKVGLTSAPLRESLRGEGRLLCRGCSWGQVEGGCGLLNISLALCLCVVVLVGGQKGRVPAPLSPGSGS